MRSDTLIIFPNISTNRLFRLVNIFISVLSHPLCFKASKEPFSWGIVPTAATTTYTLRHTIATRQGFSKYLTAIMRALIRVK